ncbi:FAD-dependent pyridine nucleotide-disulfide oxidoreductase [Penicillium soppii]|jgi:NADH dehydrogenase FAD-containing subunit|uniref:FAD-dependent pyridine nucleotide-disulfide oxidoreductase n=1 Tax=Penicillium soppii TaxID=69789 RepID=UPI0025495B02|nr:FAD-dependent pyridine nucleotide-disulfide oxidoreductase [Penicillium soppii]KAJ5872642.1 FAD-dependent pyridine nucleotide-disulfide oxidoreductase [Penicillium soppii]
MAPINIVVIGGSFAGLHIAHSVLRDVPDAKVTLINPSTSFFWNIAAPRIVAKPTAFRPEQYLLPIKDAFASYRADAFEFLPGTATAIETTAKTVTVKPNEGEAKTLSYDYLVIASGSTTSATNGSLTGTSIPFKQSNHNDMEQLIEAAQGHIAGAKEIVIGGAGPIGVELAGELAEAVERSGNTGKVSITIVSATERVLPMLKSSASAAARKMLEHKNVKVVTSKRVVRVETPADDSSSWTVSLEGGDKLSADLYIPTTGVTPNNSFIPAHLLDKDGWVTVNKEMRVQSTDGSALPIFAAGDITNNSMRLSFKAVEQAQVAAANLKAEIVGGASIKSYNQGDSIMMVVPVGETGGTGQVFGFVPFSFMVKIIKGKHYFIDKAVSALAGKA